ncbi:MAG TPA: protein phosphatase 2C domain-containing protein [Acidobacteriaceae bacterium]|nr:protein phosphatase 2C domain-containing protein [Acidobacteriaceae bacterium]
MLEIEFGQATHPGKVRTNNEDCTGYFEPRSRQEARSRGWFFALADGVGGFEFGEIASSKAIQVVCEEFSQCQENTSLISLLPRLIQHANVAVHDEGLVRERRGSHMATTIVTCALRHDQAFIAHVGDSRCYHLRDGRATPVTQDHTWVNEQRKLGLISSADVENAETRHLLTRSLGPDLFVTADSNTVSLRSGDRLVLCSDGLYGGLQNHDIARIASQSKNLDEVARDLVCSSVDADGSDNTTAVIIGIRSIEAMAMYRGRLYPRPGA